ncbi:hypothetical protein [Flavilitoribacter nigricans]|uniref:Uncharacterized protein n=1 Tax=Flavilitoribacter nigricans (strain ATCC 23147 / DSM 23189 / NBRC 102662 / NCIMB 1420 / SS-2) TaxID=1122177 RepID=A0A2D0NF77_FLAN2|nr:hypothetical protein [Flavilitoribacter nigricans]PHN07030.1 hypothetical protein CRP01_08715 [Flavilitoribacter nigricans DSM 23189 = NBRC 102662]
MKFLLLLVLSVLLPYRLIAQFEKGTITLPTGEEVNGYLRQDGDIELLEKLYFKTAPDQADARIYEPNELKAFRFEEGAEFQQIPVSFVEQGLLMSKKQFAKVMAQGTIDLYLSYGSLQKGTFVFYARKDGTLHKLSEKPLLLASGNYTQPNSYRGVLKALTFDCGELSEPDQVAFRIRAITEFINTYNGCRDAGYQAMVTDFKTRLEKQYFGEAMVGINFSHFFVTPSTTGPDRLERVIFGQAGIALQMETVNPSFSRKLVTHYSIGLYKWAGLARIGGILDETPPTATLTATVAAHFIFNPLARLKWYTRLGAAANYDFGAQAALRPGYSFGFGAYLPSGVRLGVQLISWQFRVAVPFGG